MARRHPHRRRLLASCFSLLVFSGTVQAQPQRPLPEAADPVDVAQPPGAGGTDNAAHLATIRVALDRVPGVPLEAIDPSAAASTSSQVPLPPPKRGRFKFARQVGGDFRHFPSRDTFYWLAGGAGAALAVHPADDDTNGGLRKHDRFFNPGQTVGSVYVQVGGALATYVVGRSIRKERVKHLGTDMLSAQIVAQALTQAIKVSVRRERPDGSNRHSFPSGHASATFATATVLQRHLGWKAAVPTYTIATYVAMSRLQENRHFISDVVFGAALGVAAGRTSTRHGRANWTLLPVVAPGHVALTFARLQ